jgi:peptide/nickel transport system permease protein
MSEPVLSQPLPEPSRGILTEPTQVALRPFYVRLFERLQDLWGVFVRNPKAMAGLVIVLFFVVLAIFGPLLVHTDPNAFSADVLAPPSAAHWLGTTETGQDVFAQLMVGTRSSILWGFTAGLLTTMLSVIIGLAAGYAEGAVSEALMLLINVFLVLPGLPLIVLLAAYVPQRGPATVSLVIALTSWAWNARVLRSQTLSLRHRDFVEAARVAGERTGRILFMEILPNELALVASAFITTVIYVILAAAGVEFLGLGNVTAIDWGTMFYWAQNNSALLQGAWWWFVAPGACIALLGAGLTLINFGIDEIADPRLRREKGERTRSVLRQLFSFAQPRSAA